ncbi:MAG: RloB domain-containing protein [Kiritimatiellae bacterium]|nr:RloB domain-containing protein [Kiritimatiellia bacterium]
MLKRRRPFIRYCPLVLVSSEGRVTEPEYLHAFGRQVLRDSVTFRFVPRGTDGASPDAVLKRMTLEMNRMSLRKGDEAWLVLDRDRWTDDQLRPLLDWMTSETGGIRRGIALSNPKFELWLLLHFEPISGCISDHSVDGRLAMYLPEYDKHIPAGFPTREQVEKAIEYGTLLNGPDFLPLSQNAGTGMVEMAKGLLKHLDTGGHQ